jgi:hypothetical protein
MITLRRGSPWGVAEMDWGLLVGIAGVLIAVYTYIRTRNVKSLVYDTTDREAADFAGWQIPFADVSLKFKELPIKRLFRSYVLLWNGGNNTIDFESYLNALKFSVSSEGTIFNAGIVASDDDTNGAKATVADDCKSVTMRFEYLRARDAVIIYVNHNELPSKCKFEFFDKEKNLSRKANLEMIGFFSIFIVPFVSLIIMLISILGG